jgi:hypothetical protein
MGIHYRTYTYKGKQSSHRAPGQSRRSRARPSRRLLDREVQELEGLVGAFATVVLLTRIVPDLSTASKKGELYEVEVELPQIKMRGLFGAGIGKPHVKLSRETEPPYRTVKEISPDAHWTIQTRGQLNHVLKRLSASNPLV